MSDFFSKWLAPQNAAEAVVVLLAVCLALFFVYSASNATKEPKKFWQRSRIQALFWLVSSGVTAGMIDWKAFTDESFQKGHLVGVYASWALAATLLFMTLGALGIALEAACLSRSRPRFRTEIFSMPVGFIANGWADYERRKAQLLSDSQVDLDLIADQDDEEERTTAKLLSKLSLKLLRELDEADAKGREALADEIMGVIRSELLKYADFPKPGIRINYLAVKDFRALSDTQKRSLKFAFGDNQEQRFSEVLVLRKRYSAPPGPPILIPVDNHIDYPDTLLPGAPECVACVEYTCLPCKGIEFRSGVPKHIRDSLEKYFTELPIGPGQACQTAVSIRLIKRDSTVGILNIESSATHIVGLGADAVDEILVSLKPFCFLLACVVNRDEENRNV